MHARRVSVGTREKMTMTMTMGGVRRVDVSESLFADDEETSPPREKMQSGVSAKSFEEDERPSAAMQALLVEHDEKKQRRKGRSKTIAASVFDRSRAEVETMIETGDWSQVGARHLVALYALMHVKVYGVECAELGPAERYNVAMMAAGLVKREFGGDYEKAMEYMRWAWTKEMRTEKWRRENGRTDARRIGARLMFGGSLVTDYRLFLARQRRSL